MVMEREEKVSGAVNSKMNFPILNIQSIPLAWLMPARIRTALNSLLQPKQHPGSITSTQYPLNTCPPNKVDIWSSSRRS